MIDVEYANAFYEVLKVLECVNVDDYNKIPLKLVQTFKTYANYEYDFEYDVNKTLDEQNVTKRAKAIIAILFRDYWATDTQREKIIAKQNYDRQKIEQELMEKYNPDNLFKKHEETENIETTTENNQIIPYKDSFIKKLFNKILNLFNLKNRKVE